MSVSLDRVSKAFGRTRALDAVTVEVARGELFGVLGPSGCGKTTLLRVIAGLERPDDGALTVGGKPMAGPGAWVPPDRRRIGMVFQDYALFPHLTVARNVRFGLRRGEAHRVETALELVGLQHKAASYPHELSGGERQRVALARALAPGPEVVLLDEPFSSLDASLRADLRREVEIILREAGATAILVTHDQEEALSLADRLAMMRDGRLIQVGTPQEVYTRPRSRWTAQFLGQVNVLTGVVRGAAVDTEVGTFDLPAGSNPGIGAFVHIAVRPEQLQLRADPQGDAEITEREFRGHDVVYRLRHPARRTLLVQLPSVELHEVGDRVAVGPIGQAVAAPID